MENIRRDLADIAVNEMGQLVEIPGIGKALENSELGFSGYFLEKPVNKISDCFCFQGWCDENYSRRKKKKMIRQGRKKSWECVSDLTLNMLIPIEVGNKIFFYFTLSSVSLLPSKEIPIYPFNLRSPSSSHILQL